MHEFEKFGISACKYKILDEKAKIFGCTKILSKDPKIHPNNGREFLAFSRWLFITETTVQQTH